MKQWHTWGYAALAQTCAVIAMRHITGSPMVAHVVTVPLFWIVAAEFETYRTKGEFSAWSIP